MRVHWVNVLLKNSFIYQLYSLGDFYINSEDHYNRLISLFETIDFPEMIQGHFWFSLDPAKDVRIKLENFKEYMKVKEFRYVKLYNKIIQIINQRNFDISIISSFAFLNELLTLDDTEYISTIVIPLTETTNSENIIELWINFTRSSKIKYSKIKLVCDEIEVDELQKIVEFLNNLHLKYELIFNKLSTLFLQFFETLPSAVNPIIFTLCDFSLHLLIFSSSKYLNSISLKTCYFCPYSTPLTTLRFLFPSILSKQPIHTSPYILFLHLSSLLSFTSSLTLIPTHPHPFSLSFSNSSLFIPSSSISSISLTSPPPLLFSLNFPITSPHSLVKINFLKRNLQIQYASKEIFY